jgi:hypothetical protein
MRIVFYLFSTLLGTAVTLAAQDFLLAASCESTSSRIGSEDSGIQNYWSELDWYANEARSKSGQPPGSDSSSAVAFVSSAGPFWPVVDTNGHWEDSPRKGIFLDGDTAVLTLNSGASELSFGSYAGIAKNDYREFSCYRDNGRPLYKKSVTNGQWETSTQCYSAFWCQ